MRRLVESWITAEKEGYGNSLAQAISYMNKERGIKLTYSRLAEWRRGKYTPSPQVISQMLNWVLPWALEKAGIQATDKQIEALEELIWEIKVTDGQRNIELL
jgi:hypothetical protein